MTRKRASWDGNPGRDGRTISGRSLGNGEKGTDGR